ncbi:hypothetical protein [Aeromicrobium endophyticum]|uniref:hypothetical protein n=1 Tax=Aeromicrobium endophyticum TaxID=2292704 RepID=UPI0011C37147|nr:hypothetical protein [Aeromicrobium endophyticum]
MPRITLVFTLSDPRAQADLLREFALHDGVVATPDEVEGAPAIRIEARDAVSSLWDVRATVGMFDDLAREWSAQ